MNNYIIKYIIFSSFILSNLNACSVCYGDPDSPVTKGMNNGILFMLVLICCILVSIGFFMYSLYKKQKIHIKEL